MSRIFISHSSVNNAAALALASWLETKGWSDYFLDIDDSRGIAPGERWMAALGGAVDRCEAVIFLVSPGGGTPSIASPSSSRRRTSANASSASSSSRFPSRSCPSR